GYRTEDPLFHQPPDGGHGRKIVHRGEIDGRPQRPCAIEASHDPVQVIGQIREVSLETSDVHCELGLEWSLLRHATHLVHPPHRFHQRRLRAALDALFASGPGEVDAKLAAFPGHQSPESGVAPERSQLRVDYLAVAYPD